MPTISLCMIVRNEESVLDRCLSCVKDIADEIIIVDTGSTDKQRKSPPCIRIKYTISSGSMIFQQQETFHSPKLQWIILCGLTPMM